MCFCIPCIGSLPIGSEACEKIPELLNSTMSCLDPEPSSVWGGTQLDEHGERGPDPAELSQRTHRRCSMCSQRLSKISYSCCFTDLSWELPEYGYPEDCFNCSKVVKYCKAQRKALLAKYSVFTGVRRSCLGRSFKKQHLGYRPYLQLHLSQSSADILFYSLPILCRVSSNGSGSFLLFSTDELIGNFKRHEPKALYQYTQQHTMLHPVSSRCWHGKGTHKNKWPIYPVFMQVKIPMISGGSI